MVVSVRNLSRAYESKPALVDVTFNLEAGDIACLIGPSGAGKSTLLKILAGLDKDYQGTVATDPPFSRQHPAILVFQELLLFPHMTVFENVAFGLRARGVKGRDLASQVLKVLEYFGLAERAQSLPHQISGGQKQRVALARALVVRPALLLLDEPFANLDKNLKREMAEFLRKTALDFGMTTLAVSHDLEEAFIMADKIGLMNQGRLIQFGTLEDLIYYPVNWEAAKFLGAVNVFEPEEAFQLGLSSKPERSLAFRAESLEPIVDPHGPLVITGRRFLGKLFQYVVKLKEKEFEIVSLSDGLLPGQRVRLKVRKGHQPIGGNSS